MDFTQNSMEGMNHLTESGAFLTAKSGLIVNTMTISWGFIGVIWGKPYFITAVRPQRYTKTLLDAGGSFTISVPWSGLREELKICGEKSGSDIDKSRIVSFIPSQQVEAPVVEGCQTYWECRIRYFDALEPDKIPEAVKSAMYQNDFHTLYFGEIVAAYEG